MKHIIYAALAILAGLLFSHTPTARAQQQTATTTPAQTSSGGYTTFIGGQPFGTETYTLTTGADGSRKSVADVAFGGVKSSVTTVVAQNRPVSFTMEMGGTKALTENFTAQDVKIAAQGQPEREVKSQATVLLENGVWHHFLFLFAQYDAAKGAPQNFTAFLPSQALEFTLSLERIDAPTFNVKGQQVATEHYRIVTNLGLTLEIWTDSSRVPLVFSVPAQRIKAIRQGAETLAEAILPAPAASAAASPNDPFTSEAVTFENGAVKLAGTLTIPKTGASPFPAAIIITGSGPQDRDGSNIANIYKLVAERLSSNGVAVLRVDDRGAGESSMPAGSNTSYRDLVNDTRAGVELLLKRREIDPQRIALVGHSEGAETALTIAAEDARIAAVALLAGTSRTVDRVLVEQSLYALALDAPVNASDTTKFNPVARQLMKIFEDVKASPKTANSSTDKYGWFREHLESDPLALTRRVRVPVLILNGERDGNVLPYHALELAQALAAGGNKQVMLRIFPNLTHLFTPSTLDKSINDRQAGEVSPEFLQTLQTWMTNTLARSGAK